MEVMFFEQGLYVTSHFLNSNSKSAYIKMIIIILNNYYLKCNFSLMIKRKYKIIYIFNLNIFYKANSIVFEKTEH